MQLEVLRKGDGGQVRPGPFMEIDFEAEIAGLECPLMQQVKDVRADPVDPMAQVSGINCNFCGYALI